MVNPAASKTSAPVVMQASLPTMLGGIKRRNQKARTIRHFTSYYAKLNLKRGGTRSIVTILSLVMSITVFVALQSFTALLDVGGDLYAIGKPFVVDGNSPIGKADNAQPMPVYRYDVTVAEIGCFNAHEHYCICCFTKLYRPFGCGRRCQGYASRRLFDYQ